MKLIWNAIQSLTCRQRASMQLICQSQLTAARVSLTMSLPFSLSVLLLVTASSQAAELRIAIVPADPRCAVQAELLTVEFSRAEHGVTLLERAEVERIRREQNLTARSSADFARLGQALGAQGVLVLDVFEQKDTTNLTAKLIAVQPGVALGFQSYPWPLKDVTQWAGVVGKQFAGLLPKLNVLAQDAIPISILNLRSPLKTSEGVRLENEATALLIHRLIAQREIFVLERQRMALLGGEKELKDVQESPFWNGAYLLEGVVERGGATRDALTINTRLVAPGRPSQTVSGKSDASDLNALIDQLARDLISRLSKTTNIAPWNPAAEAKRYLQEAKWGGRWGNLELAQAAADSAWALGEHSLETALLRVNAYNWGSGTNAEALRYIATSLENFVALTPALGTNAEAREWRQSGLTALSSAIALLSRAWHNAQSMVAVPDEMERLRELARESERVLLNGEQRPEARTYASGMGTNLWTLKLNNGWAYAESAQETLAEFRRLFAGMSRAQLVQVRELIHPWLMPWAAADRAQAEALWSNFVEELSRSTNAFTALTARMMVMNASMRRDPWQHEPSSVQAWQRAAELLLRRRHDFLCHEPELAAKAITQLDRLMRDQGRLVNFSYGVRTNFFHAMVLEKECSDERLLGTCIFAPAFDTNHLNFLVERISEGVGTNSPAQSRRHFLRIYLGNQYRWYVIEKLFRAEDYADPTEARKMLETLNQFVSYYRGLGADDNVLAFALKPAAVLRAMLPSSEKQPATTAPIPTPASTVATNAAEPNTLLVNRWWQPVFTQSPTQELVAHFVNQILAREGYVWALVRGVYRFKVPTEFPDQYVFAERTFEQFFRVDPADLSAVAAPILWRQDGGVLLYSMFTPLTQFDVLDGVL